MPSPYLLTTVEKVLDWLNITDTQNRNNETKFLLSVIRQKSNVINTFLNRQIRLQTFTEFYDGDGTNELQLRNYPVCAITSIHVSHDIPRVFTSDELIPATDYDVDERTGLIYSESFKHFNGAFHGHGHGHGIHLNDHFGFGTFGHSRDNIQVIYTAGFNDFKIGTGDNDTIEWDNGSAQLATLTAGVYTGTSLASHIQTQMNAEISATDPYTVVYSNQTGKFKLSSTESIFLLQLFNGTLPDQTVANTIGFDESVTGSGQLSTEWGTWTPENGTIAADVVTTITPTSKTGRIKIFNGGQSSNQDLLYSLDGSNFFNIPPFVPLPGDLIVNLDATKPLLLKCNAGITTDFFVAYTTEDGGSGVFESDITVIGIPDAIEDACIRLVALGYKQSDRGDLNDLGLKSLGSAPGGSETYDKEEQQNILKEISSFKRRFI